MANTHNPKGRWKGSFHPGQVTQMRLDPNCFAAGFYHVDSQNMFAQPCRWAGGPAMTQAVTIAFITIVTVVAMNILHPCRDQLVNASRIVGPVKIKILPKGGRAVIEHAAPILA